MLKSARLAFVLALTVTASASAAPLVVISIDGMRPDYVSEADRHGLKIPTLRKMREEGAYAEGVIGVNPTVTYPSHTTIVTGVSPAEHGIYNNTPFDPTGANRDGWYWYAADIKVPTLFDAVSAAHKVTANVEWPVTVGAQGIRYNIPEYRRAKAPDDLKLLESLVRPDGYLEELEKTLGPYTYNGNESIPDDEVRTRFALEVIRDKKPYFMTIHLIALDHESHAHGPFSRQANAALEAIDGMVDRVSKTARANDPETVIAVVSDHGFAPVTHAFNWRIAFAQAGLIKKNSSEEWQVSLWSAAGANAAVMLREPRDTKRKAQVEALLKELATHPDYGISAVLSADEIKASGGWPTASFILAMKPGYVIGGAWTGDFVTTERINGGTHGWLPSEPEMHAAFLVSGVNITKHTSLGFIDMRQIAPTFAQILAVDFPAVVAPIRVLGTHP